MWSVVPLSIYSYYTCRFFCGSLNDSPLLRLGVSCGASLSAEDVLFLSLDWLFLSVDLVDLRFSLSFSSSLVCLFLSVDLADLRFSLSFSSSLVCLFLSVDLVDLRFSLSFGSSLCFAFGASSGSCSFEVMLFSLIVPPRTGPRRNPLNRVRRAYSCLAIVDKALRGTYGPSVLLPASFPIVRALALALFR